jgi:hypothetical protein
MKKLLFVLTASMFALVTAALAGDNSTAAANTATPPTSYTISVPVAKGAPKPKKTDPAAIAMGDGPGCTDGSCCSPLATAKKPFLSPRAAQLAAR